ncbi:MAG TPA: FecR domain-containing protein [Methylomirabilota bacterium]|nr:FecR domain-containing protein [Methylomirabilota bacterium]
MTTLDGRATVARAVLPGPLALKFKDDVFGRDLIRTQERSLVRVLLGGKALLTVRELSQVTISEEPGRAVVTLPDGKVVLGVAKQRLRPGESIEIRTPNAVAAVRGSVLAVSFDKALGVTTAICGSGDCTYQHGTSPTNPLLPGHRAINDQIAPAPPDEVNEAVTVQTSARGFTSPEPGFQTLLLESQTAQATQVAQFVNTGTVAPLPPSGAGIPNQTPATAAPITATDAADELLLSTQSTSTASPPPPAPKGELIIAGGFEASPLPVAWTLDGVGGVVTNLGSITPPEGQRMALIHTELGALPVASLPTALDVPPNAVAGSVLRQSFSAQSGSLYTVKVTYNFLSNEYPTFFAGGQSSVNDTFRARLTDPSGQTVEIAEASLNGSFPSGVSPETATAAGFTIFEGNGVTGFTTATRQWVPEGAGTSTLFFDIYNVGDNSVSSAALIDAVTVGQDPPLHFLRRGDALTRTQTDPLLRLSNATGSFDSLMVVCCDARASLAGPLLHATDSNLTVPWSLLAVLQGGAMTTSSTEALARLDGGSHSFGGAGVPMFDLYGVATAVDSETGLPLGTHRPLQHGGALLETSNAVVNASQVVRVDNALLEATAPLLALKNGSQLTTSNDTVQLSYQAKVTSLGSVMKLDRSALTIARGSALNLAGGSVLRVTGDLFSLSNGSSLNLLSGALLSLSGGSALNVSGALIGFGGTGGNLVSVNNSFCPCTTIGGVPVSLTGGAVAANVSIAGAIKNSALGAVNVAPNAALIRVDGAGTKVTINGL